MIRLLRTIVVVSLTIFFSNSFAVLCAQEDSDPADPAVLVQEEDPSTKKDATDYTDDELVDLYLNDPQNLPEMDDETLTRISALAHEMMQEAQPE